MQEQIRYNGPSTGRNHPCTCGSGLKFKHCHNDPLKIAVCNRVMMEKMVELILREKIKKGMICIHGTKKGDHCKACKIGDI